MRMNLGLEGPSDREHLTECFFRNEQAFWRKLKVSEENKITNPAS